MEASRAALVGTLALLGLLVISMGWGRAMTGGRRGDGHFGEKISLQLQDSEFLAVMERANPEVFIGPSGCGEVCTYAKGTGDYHSVAVGDGKVGRLLSPLQV